jgi:hypothetical protein
MLFDFIYKYLTQKKPKEEMKFHNYKKILNGGFYSILLIG